MFNSILDILKKLQQENPNFARRLVESQALDRWEGAVGPQIAKHARAIRVQDRTLFVEVAHPIWKQELQHRKRQILDKINANIGTEPPILEVFFLDPRSR